MMDFMTHCGSSEGNTLRKYAQGIMWELNGKNHRKKFPEDHGMDTSSQSIDGNKIGMYFL